MKKFLLTVACAAMSLGAMAQTYALTGAFNGWAISADAAFSGEGDVLTLNLPKLTSGFKVVTLEGNWNPQWGCHPGEVITPGTAYSLLSNTDNGGKDPDNMNFDVMTQEVNNAVVTLNVKDFTLLIEGDVVTNYPDLYYAGSNAGNWGAPGSVENTLFSRDGDTYTLNVTFGASDEFKIFLGAGWGTNYGAAVAPANGNPSEPALTAENLTATLVLNGQNVSAIGLEGEKTLTFDIKTGVITVSDAAGIDALEADNNAPAVYYNLQGVRVASPEAGLFIKVQGKNVSKVIL